MAREMFECEYIKFFVNDSRCLEKVVEIQSGDSQNL
jgi:hypothetical protein